MSHRDIKQSKYEVFESTLNHLFIGKHVINSGVRILGMEVFLTLSLILLDTITKNIDPLLKDFRVRKEVLYEKYAEMLEIRVETFLLLFRIPSIVLFTMRHLEM